MRPMISVVVPCLNEAQSIRRVILSVEAMLRGLVAESFEIIVINDGSDDGTADVVAELAKKMRELILVNQENRGYGGALKRGYSKARGEWIVLFPGDGQFRAKAIKTLWKYSAEQGADIVAPKRCRRAEGFYRRLNQFLYNSLLKILFNIDHGDINCGIKLFRGDLVRSLTLCSDGALIDAELFLKARAWNVVISKPYVNHYPRRYGSPTGANVSVILKMFSELKDFWIKNRKLV